MVTLRTCGASSRCMRAPLARCPLSVAWTAFGSSVTSSCTTSTLTFGAAMGSSARYTLRTAGALSSFSASDGHPLANSSASGSPLMRSATTSESPWPSISPSLNSPCEACSSLWPALSACISTGLFEATAGTRVATSSTPQSSPSGPPYSLRCGRGNRLRSPTGGGLMGQTTPQFRSSSAPTLMAQSFPSRATPRSWSGDLWATARSSVGLWPSFAQCSSAASC
mmetsp:Transcript_19438/g.42479  ORF Transcript_19438/g.42479 Transcript_19438/m.42479 type:complete len:224 (-) Transcript_19438:1149-1820(-)